MNSSTIDNNNIAISFNILGITIGLVGLKENSIALAAIYVAVKDMQPVHRFLINLSISDIGLITGFVIEQVYKITLNDNKETSTGVCIAGNLLGSLSYTI